MGLDELRENLEKVLDALDAEETTEVENVERELHETKATLHSVKTYAESVRHRTKDPLGVINFGDNVPAALHNLANNIVHLAGGDLEPVEVLGPEPEPLSRPIVAAHQARLIRDCIVFTDESGTELEIVPAGDLGEVDVYSETSFIYTWPVDDPRHEGKPLDKRRAHIRHIVRWEPQGYSGFVWEGKREVVVDRLKISNDVTDDPMNEADYTLTMTHENKVHHLDTTTLSDDQ